MSVKETSGYYGCYFDENNVHHVHHDDKYESRSQALIHLMEDLKKNIEEEFSIENVLVLNYQNIYIAMGRYFNVVKI